MSGIVATRRSRSRSRSRSWDQHDRRGDRDRGDRRRGGDRGDLRERIDKRRLLEVARRNAQRLGEEGLLPAGLEGKLPDGRRGAATNLRQLTGQCASLSPQLGQGRWR